MKTDCRTGVCFVLFSGKVALAGMLAFVLTASLAAAGEIDLTATDVLSTQTAVTGGQFKVYHFGTSTGPGIGSNDAFLELQQAGGSGSEQGYNTDGTAQFSTTKDAEALLLSAIPVVNIGGVNYLEIGLGLNNTGSQYTSLDELQIFQSDSAVLDATVNGGYDAGTAEVADDNLSGISPVFDWFGDDSASYAVLSDDAGQSHVDYLFFVPTSLIDNSKDYIYLYTEMGYTASCLSGEDCVANDGSDRWVVSDDHYYPIPEPAALVLCGVALACLTLTRHK